MKIVDRKTFLSMPAGTVFSEYEPCVFGDIFIKESSVGENDYIAQSLKDSFDCADSTEYFEMLHQSETEGMQIAMSFDNPTRDGGFDKEQLYAVWSKEDVESLIARLRETL